MLACVRAGEVHGVNYWFVDKATMEREIAEGKFLETARVHANTYGTSYAAIEGVTRRHRICILDIDVQVRAAVQRAARSMGIHTTDCTTRVMQGVRTYRKTELPARFVFVAPPSIDALEERLRKRGAFYAQLR